jgi:hypothetical protein
MIAKTLTVENPQDSFMDTLGQNWVRIQKPVVTYYLASSV